MDWAALAIITLLIVAIVSFLAFVVLILQYYTVTKETKVMKENIYFSKNGKRTVFSNKISYTGLNE